MKSTKEINEFAENIINAVREPLLLLDKELRIVKASWSFYDFFKVTSDETIGTLIYDLGNGQWNIPKLKELLETILPEKTTFNNYEVEHDFSAIGKRILLLNARQIKKGLGKEQIILISIEDITELKRAEEKVRESEERFQLIFENVLDGISIYNEDPDPSKRRLIECNKRYAIQAGQSRDELLRLGSTLGLQITLDDKANASRLQSIDSGTAYQGYFSWIRPDGKENVIEYVGMPINWRGHSYSIGIDRDITERKLAEEEINNAYKELERLSTEKDKLFSIIAHDLRSPFHGLLGLTEILATNCNEMSSEEISKFSSKLHDSVINLYALLGNLLEWGQLQKGTIGFMPETLYLYGIFSKSIDSIIQRAFQKGITIFNEIPETLKIYADEKMISSVLRNLLFNAIKFTRNGGKVIGKARKTYDGLVEISVTDTGVGILRDNIGKLFKLGEKVSSLGTDNEPSTGLGLVLCKEFIEKNGGKIWVESEEGVGSTFYFTLLSRV